MQTTQTTATSTDPYFDKAEALKRLSFFPKYLRHTEGARFKGKPFDLLPWEAQIVSDLFGWKWYDPELEREVRWHTEAFLEIGAKNGKTELGAGLGLSLMCQDGESNGFIFSIASDRDQARIVYNVAKGFVENSPALSKRIRVPTGRYANWLEHRNGNIWRVLPGDETGNDGEKSIAVIMDEVHRIKNPELYGVMKKSLAASLQGLFIGMTTAGDDRSQLWLERRQYAEAVEKGTVDNQRFYSMRFCADPDDQWDDEDTWRKANPSLGVTKTIAFMRELADAARVSPAQRATFKRLHLNIPNQSDDLLIDVDAWKACPSETEPEMCAGKAAWAGLDMSSTTDITAAAFVVPDDKMMRVFWRFWMPEDTAQRRSREDAVPFIEWARDGWITLTPGNEVDYDLVRKEFYETANNLSIQDVGYDRWNSTQIVQQLVGDGFNMIPIPQGFASLSAPTKALLSMVASGRLDHGGNPVARWMAGNAVGKTDDNENIMPSKGRSRGRIDGIAALVDALFVWQRQPAPEGPSVYETRGILTLG